MTTRDFRIQTVAAAPPVLIAPKTRELIAEYGGRGPREAA